MGDGRTGEVARRAGKEWSHKHVYQESQPGWDTLPPSHQKHAETLPNQVGSFNLGFPGALRLFAYSWQQVIGQGRHI